MASGPGERLLHGDLLVQGEPDQQRERVVRDQLVGLCGSRWRETRCSGGRWLREIERTGRAPFDDDVVAVANEADLFVLNLECCISERGQRWPDPRKPFFFRAPPLAAELLAEMGVDCVTLANNHALDYGPQALLDTLDHLSAVGIACVGAGPNAATARASRLLAARHMRLAVLGASDHPEAFAAGPDRPGIAYADLRDDPRGGWLADAVAAARRAADAVLVTPHWGPNMTVRPSSAIRQAARALLSAGATLVAGHSAHLPHGTERGVLYDLGDFVDDYAVDPRLRNDLGLLFLIDLDAHGPRARSHPAQARALPHAHRPRRRRRLDPPPLHDACAVSRTEVTESEARLHADLRHVDRAATRHGHAPRDHVGLEGRWRSS